MPGEEVGGALGSFGDILVSGEVPALTLGVMGGISSALTLGLWVAVTGSGDGSASAGTAGCGSGGVG